MGNSGHKSIRNIPITAFRKICLIPVIISQIGIYQTVIIGYAYFFEPLIMKVIPLYAGLIKKTRQIGKKVSAKHDLANWNSQKTKIISGNDDILDITGIGLHETGLNLVKEKLKETKSLVIANIGRDGSFLSYFGPIDGVRCVRQENFLPHDRFKLDLVTINGMVGIKKSYNGSDISFLHEIEALHFLRIAGCNVPSILDADFKNSSLTVSYIPGTTLNEQLRLQGDVLRAVDPDENSRFMQLSPEKRRSEEPDKGKKYLLDSVNGVFIEKLFDQVIKIHSAGFVLNASTFGNVLIERKTGNPCLFDFESSDNFTGSGHTVFRAISDSDIEKFNSYFGTDKPTYRRLRKIISNREFPSPETWYANSYFGAGLIIGRLWNIDVGWGRWHSILKKNLPDLRGKRVLDLGSNNGFNSLQILRNGAREAIGVEINSVAIDQELFLKTVAEWSDCKKYNFSYIQSSMAKIISMDLGNFDLVLSLCSIYYLNDQEICELIRHISTITDSFIVQCNEEYETGRNDHLYEKSSVEYLKKALEANGFPRVKVVAPRGYSRPLLIGKK